MQGQQQFTDKVVWRLRLSERGRKSSSKEPATAAPMGRLITKLRHPAWVAVVVGGWLGMVVKQAVGRGGPPATQPLGLQAD